MEKQTRIMMRDVVRCGICGAAQYGEYKEVAKHVPAHPLECEPTVADMARATVAHTPEHTAAYAIAKAYLELAAKVGL